MPSKTKTFWDHLKYRQAALYKAEKGDRAVLQFRPGVAKKGQLIIEEPEAWVEIKLNDEWCAALRLLPQGDAPIISEARIYPRKARVDSGRWSQEADDVPAGGLPFTILRNLHANDCAKVLQTFYREVGMIVGRGSFYSATSHPKRKRSVQKNAITDQYLVQVAQTYVANGYSTNAVANQFGLTYDTAADHVSRARKGQLLAPTLPGKRGGDLTAKALALLGPKKARPRKERLRGSR